MNRVLQSEMMRTEVAMRAYDIWMRRTGADDMQDWLDAESEIDPNSSGSRLHMRMNDEAKAPSSQCRLLELEAQLAKAIHEHQQDELLRQAYYNVVHSLATSLSFADAAPGIVQAICRGIRWDFGALWMLDPSTEVLRCVALWHDPSACLEEFSSASQRQAFFCGTELPGQVWERNLSIWIDDLARDQSSSRAQLAARVNLHSAMGFPIRCGATFTGVLELLTCETTIPNDAVLAMLNSTCSNVGDCIERHRHSELLNQHKQERHLAKRIQQQLLPKAGVRPAELVFSGRSDPSGSVGGDYFDFFQMRDGSVGFVVGDASGHGIGAAMLISETRAYLRALALTSSNPSEILTLTNQRLVQDLSGEHFVTLLLLRLDHTSRSLQCAGAGHHPGYVLSPSGAVKAVLSSESLPLGMESAGDFAIGRDIHLDLEDVIFLYTDGIVEASGTDDDQPFGIGRALDCLRSNARKPLEEMLDALYNAVYDFSAGSAQTDDITALLIRV